MNRKLTLSLVVLALVCLMPAVAAAQDSTLTPAQAVWTPVYEVEPNNTSAQANPSAYGSVIQGQLGPSDAVDFFKFSGQAGQKVALAHGWNSADPTVELFNPAGNPVALAEPSRWVMLQATGVYRIRVTMPNSAQYERSYEFYLLQLTGSEPNDTKEQAIPAQALQTVEGTYDYPCDDDWYVFSGRAGDVFPIVYRSNQYWEEPIYYLYDAAGNWLDGLNVLPADGVYYLRVNGLMENDDEWACPEGPYTVTFGYPLWVSADVDALGGNAAIQQQDIAMRANQPGKWQLVFDASDVGITQDLVAFEQIADGSILMSLFASQTVPGLGKVMPQDIIRFVPTSLGTNTAGAFDWYLDGSDVGLTTTGEKIDAIFLKPDPYDPNPLVISLSGTGSIPRQSGGTLTVADEDLINFVGSAYGAATAGMWRIRLDGSTLPGLAAEDINAAESIDLSPPRFSRTIISLFDSFNLGGLTGGPRDVVFAGDGLAVKNLTDKKIDALAVGVALP